MSTIKINTLTPVHIGSGNLLQYNTEFVPFKLKGNQMIGIIDERKILDLIGVEHLNDWVLSIERRESTKDLVKRYAPQSMIGQYLKRYEQSFADVKPTDTLKECMHDGMGIPYIPGSSLKGAIRTAVTATLVSQYPPTTSEQSNVRKLATMVEGRLFGRNPQEDVFRFVQVGDAYFAPQCEIALRLIMSMNITQSSTLYPKVEHQKPQLVEAICVDEQSTFSMKIDTASYTRCKSKMEGMGTLPMEIQTLQGLFYLVNQHTIRLVNEEISYWEEVNKQLTGAEAYINQMREILEVANQCSSDSCVLRLGHASGWRFITGAWGEQLPCFETQIVNQARPKNENYSGYDFPKSRRTDSDGDLLGFIKLTIQ